MWRSGAVPRCAWRSSDAGRLTPDEIEQLTGPQANYRTNYTYAYSRAYMADAPDTVLIPNLASPASDGRSRSPTPVQSKEPQWWQRWAQTAKDFTTSLLNWLLRLPVLLVFGIGTILALLVRPLLWLGAFIYDSARSSVENGKNRIAAWRARGASRAPASRSQSPQAQHPNVRHVSPDSTPLTTWPGSVRRAVSSVPQKSAQGVGAVANGIWSAFWRLANALLSVLGLLFAGLAWLANLLGVGFRRSVLDPLQALSEKVVTPLRQSPLLARNVYNLRTRQVPRAEFERAAAAAAAAGSSTDEDEGFFNDHPSEDDGGDREGTPSDVRHVSFARPIASTPRLGARDELARNLQTGDGPTLRQRRAPAQQSDRVALRSALKKNGHENGGPGRAAAAAVADILLGLVHLPVLVVTKIASGVPLLLTAASVLLHRAVATSATKLANGLTNSGRFLARNGIGLVEAAVGLGAKAKDVVQDRRKRRWLLFFLLFLAVIAALWVLANQDGADPRDDSKPRVQIVQPPVGERDWEWWNVSPLGYVSTKYSDAMDSLATWHPHRRATEAWNSVKSWTWGLYDWTATGVGGVATNVGGVATNAYDGAARLVLAPVNYISEADFSETTDSVKSTFWSAVTQVGHLLQTLFQWLLALVRLAILYPIALFDSIFAATPPQPGHFAATNNNNNNAQLRELNARLDALALRLDDVAKSDGIWAEIARIWTEIKSLRAALAGKGETERKLERTRELGEMEQEQQKQWTTIATRLDALAERLEVERTERKEADAGLKTHFETVLARMAEQLRGEKLEERRVLEIVHQELLAQTERDARGDRIERLEKEVAALVGGRADLEQRLRKIVQDEKAVAETNARREKERLDAEIARLEVALAGNHEELKQLVLNDVKREVLAAVAAFSSAKNQGGGGGASNEEVALLHAQLQRVEQETKRKQLTEADVRALFATLLREHKSENSKEQTAALNSALSTERAALDARIATAIAALKTGDWKTLEARLMRLVEDRLTNQSAKSATDKTEIDQETRAELTALRLQLADIVAKQQGASNSNLGVSLNEGDDQNSALVAWLQAFVAAELRRHDADHTGKADYALEPSGASVLSTRCSETYSPSTRLEKIFNIPLYYSSYGPRTVISRSSSSPLPGECWAFKGGHGFLTVQLSHAINVSSVSYEHIPIELSPTGAIVSAPKTLRFWAYQSVDDFTTRHELGVFEYDIAPGASPLQEWTVQKPSPYASTPIVELEVLANHDAPFTCLYRLRVHGKLAQVTAT